MDFLEKLNRCNTRPILSVEDARFASFGRVLHGFDFTDAMAYMREKTALPSDGNLYVASDAGLESLPVKDEVQSVVYGGMEIQLGYCNGRNTTFNGFEYHKGSEINVAVTGFMLALGHSYEIQNNRYDVSQATVFYVPEGTAVELYQTTLHLSPMRVCDGGYRAIVILPRGTNTPLTDEEKQRRDCSRGTNAEAVLLLQRNKWVIAHPERFQLTRQGAHPGVTGENTELFYPAENA